MANANSKMGGQPSKPPIQWSLLRQFCVLAHHEEQRGMFGVTAGEHFRVSPEYLSRFALPELMIFVCKPPENPHFVRCRLHLQTCTYVMQSASEDECGSPLEIRTITSLWRTPAIVNQRDLSKIFE
jgi:hypothetical protein